MLILGVTDFVEKYFVNKDKIYQKFFFFFFDSQRILCSQKLLVLNVCIKSLSGIQRILYLRFICKIQDVSKIFCNGKERDL